MIKENYLALFTCCFFHQLSYARDKNSDQTDLWFGYLSNTLRHLSTTIINLIDYDHFIIERIPWCVSILSSFYILLINWYIYSEPGQLVFNKITIDYK